MRFVHGYGNVADCPADADAHVLYRPELYFDGETELVGQIVKWGRKESSLVVSGRNKDGLIEERRIIWEPIFQRYVAI
ncbi:hypothetical protein [Alicyclobacillus acidoterrestris]|uniref:Uncharacterized protein n=1 Tax=Alicyclobacillus acidoterrestris (strain ATCC 49025 / DSM 3922 / CIP 106132 / NCIMB 13137 / GD3B) TaxID=1356854 RepID=T0BIJ9_ALIAG|nr:hypothetical protein [Alicyclobacillus acidoterrestris]EPZ43808.1 hypothetical protein N007_12200 [Alicyclobacillus acidoterrestris ATCC 49025]UNO50999.1 hypothetical protein K1I37_21255 [Alicyclobacillus acidoterrestris]GEO27931.1 hypothetical protein AAC03nite_37160 [Alicyclobacillus acidoterrestris]